MGKLMAWICPECGMIYPLETGSACEKCGTQLVCTDISAAEVNSLEPARFEEWYEKAKQKHVVDYEAKKALLPELPKAPQYIPKCPTCGCPNIRRLHTSEAAFDGAQLIGHANWTFKTFVCLNCGYAW